MSLCRIPGSCSPEGFLRGRREPFEVADLDLLVSPRNFLIDFRLF